MEREGDTSSAPKPPPPAEEPAGQVKGPRSPRPRSGLAQLSTAASIQMPETVGRKVTMQRSTAAGGRSLYTSEVCYLHSYPEGPLSPIPTPNAPPLHVHKKQRAPFSTCPQLLTTGQGRSGWRREPWKMLPQLSGYLKLPRYFFSPSGGRKGMLASFSPATSFTTVALGWDDQGQKLRAEAGQGS